MDNMVISWRFNGLIWENQLKYSFNRDDGGIMMGLYWDVKGDTFWQTFA